MDGDAYISTMSSKKVSAKGAELLAGERAQIGSTRTVSAPLSGGRSCGARLADVISSDARSGVRLVQGCEGDGAATRASSDGVWVRIARSRKVVDLQRAGEWETSSGGVVAALVAQIAELHAAAAADRVTMAGLRQEKAQQAQVLRTTAASLQQANAALQNSALLLRRQGEQIGALQHELKAVEVASLSLAQHACAWQQQCVMLLQWGTAWAAYSYSFCYHSCCPLELQVGAVVAAGDGCFAGDGCPAGGGAGVGRGRGREAETAVGTGVGVCGEAAGGCGGSGAGTRDCSTEDEGKERSSAPVLSTTSFVGDSLSSFPVPHLPPVVFQPISPGPRVFRLLPSDARTILSSSGPGCPFLVALSSSSPMLLTCVAALFLARAVAWVARRDALGLSGLERGKCMAARTDSTLLGSASAFALCF